MTNANEYLAGKTDRFKVEEVGPYVYRELLSHENVTFNDNDTLSFRLSHKLKFEPELSNGRSEDDLMMLPNVAMLSLAQLGSESYFTRFGVNMLIRNLNAQPIVQQTAKEIMFGYETTLVTLGHALLPSWIDFAFSFTILLTILERLTRVNGTPTIPVCIKHTWGRRTCPNGTASIVVTLSTHQMAFDSNRSTKIMRTKRSSGKAFVALCRWCRRKFCTKTESKRQNL
jgi:hypothetical protein